MKRSLTKMVIALFSLLILGFLLFSVTETIINKYHNNANQKLLKQDKLCTKIYENLHEMLLLSRGYLSAGDKQLFLDYNNLSYNLDNSIEDYSLYSQELNTEIYSYLRRLSSYNEYSRFIFDNIEETNTYDSIVYLNHGLENQLLDVQKMMTLNHTIISASLEKILQQYSYYKLILLIVIIIYFLMVSLFFINFLRNLAASLKEIEVKVNALKNHDWATKDIELKNYIEIDNLTTTINAMKHELISYVDEIKSKNKLELRLAQNETALINAKLHALRSQMNPHFLFNALNIIGKSALIEDPELALELIEATSKILRYSLSTNENLVTVEREMEAVNSYLFIQKSRFGNMISIDIDIPPEAKNKKIPPMVIQTIVENCFKHGFGHHDSLSIKILMRVNPNELLIKIIDDGVGFDAMDFFNRESKGVGLYNVYQRMKLRFAREDLIEINSNSSYGGTTVTLHILEKDIYGHENFDS
ncbi:MAG: histidine kinase [Sphaerochaetaceae bacterium]|nr:histidine kinase [Sphaerochaetaceae bacterium]